MAVSLSTLRCTGCNAPLVLADADTVVCAGCGTLTAVPAAYRDLVRARTDDAQLRGEAESVLRHLARPAPFVVKLLARMFDLPVFVSLMLYGIPATLFAGLRGVAIADAYTARHHLPDGATTPTLILMSVTLGILFAFAFVPRALGVYANRRTADRAKILAALAAHPPHTPGGAASCRACGAPLDVAPDALVATCTYCSVQSAVRVPPEIAALATVQTAALGTTLHAAVELDRGERRATLRQLGIELVRYASFVLITAGVLMLGFVSTAASAISGVAFAGVLFYRAATVTDVDARARRKLNDVPGWVVGVGPLLVWGLFEYAPRTFGL